MAHYQYQQRQQQPHSHQQYHQQPHHQHQSSRSSNNNSPRYYGPQTTAPRGGRGRMANDLGATFYPGGSDDIMPDLNIVSPAPQRVMPEVPVQIADSLEHLELEATSRGPRLGPQGNYQNAYSNGAPPGHRPISEDRRSSYHSSIADEFGYDEPFYSPFPRLENPGPNIPPSDEEKEMQIEQARMDVLSSNDPEMQLVWAQDALNYVEIAMNHYARISDPPVARPATPPLEHQIKTDAINVVSFLADQHHPRAEFMRGNWLEFGKFGFRADKKEAFRCYARAAEKGFARAEYRMGMQFENSSEPQKAIRHYERGARAGDSASNYRLGMMTLLGQHGYKQDFARGCDLIRIAADTADENAPQGAYVYGMLLARELPGIEVPEGYLPVDINLAKEMIEKAAFLGFARAQLKMGTAYELCQLNCDFSPALSLHYNALAARQGEAEADMAISKWFLCGHEGVFDKNEELAYVYAKRAAASGLGTAEFAIGYFYEIGMYVQVDLKEAQRWYARAAEHGNKDASGRIDGISRSKTLSRKDHENVAIGMIKSRHGSMRKANPVAGRGPRGPQPDTIAEVDMPEPGQYGYPNGPVSAHDRVQHPPRQGSMPPINTNFIRTDDGMMPPHGPMNMNPHNLPPRSGTAVPFQNGPRPGSSNGLNPGHQTPIRPSSASGYGGPTRPPPPGVQLTDRPFPANGSPGMIPPAGTYPTGPIGPMGPPRNQGPPMMNGPGGPGRRPSGSHPQGRPPFAGPGGPPMHPGSPGPGPHGYPNRPPPGPQGRPPADGRPRPPPVDIGFEAPKPKSSMPPRSPGGFMSPGPNGKPVGLPSSPSPNGASWSSQNKPLLPPPQQQGPPPMQQQAPPPMVQQQAPPPKIQHQQQPSKGSKASDIDDQVFSPQSQHSSNSMIQDLPPKPVAKPPPPGKGPKTFEDMGVPQPPKEQDCCIM